MKRFQTSTQFLLTFCKRTQQGKFHDHWSPLSRPFTIRSPSPKAFQIANRSLNPLVSNVVSFAKARIIQCVFGPQNVAERKIQDVSLKRYEIWDSSFEDCWDIYPRSLNEIDSSCVCSFIKWASLVRKIDVNQPDAWALHFIYISRRIRRFIPIQKNPWVLKSVYGWKSWDNHTSSNWLISTNRGIQCEKRPSVKTLTVKSTFD